MDDGKIEHVIPTKMEIDQAANAVLGNPDTSKFGAPPDGYPGDSSITSVTMQTDINLSDYPGADRIYIVQWPFECVAGSTPVAHWVVGGNGSVNPAAQATNGLFQFAATVEPLWGGAGYSASLQVGGVCAYIMGKTAGGLHKSPFPSTQADVFGPADPIATIQLQPTPDVAHDFFRLLGGSFEIIDTTAQLYQQGSTVSCCIDNPSMRPVLLTLADSLSPPPPSGTTQTASLVLAEVKTLPFGSTQDMTKVCNNLSMSAKEGVFAPTRMNLDDNRPDCGFNVQQIFVGPYGATCQQARPDLNVCLLLHNSVKFDQQFSTVKTSFSNPTWYTGVCYSTNAAMSQTVITGINTTNYSCRLVRKIVSQCFVNAASKNYFALAAPNRVPQDPMIMAALQNAQRGVTDFFPSSYNFTGKAFKKLRGAFNAGLKIAKPITGVAGGMMKNMVAQAVANNPAVAAVKGALGESNAAALQATAKNLFGSVRRGVRRQTKQLVKTQTNNTKKQ